MSEFDKEAEREKLREKYERDKENREATERMSDLLLKGATMTNTHCGTCGDPIFRHEGQEFCPTCQEVVTDGQEPQDQSQTEATETVDAPETGGSAGSSATDSATTVDPGDTDDDTTDASAPHQPSDGTQQPTATRQPADTRSREDTASAATANGSTPRNQPDAAPIDAEGASLATARASLSRTVTRLAQQAEASDDLERARAYLAATEEAADALAAVERADR